MSRSEHESTPKLTHEYKAWIKKTLSPNICKYTCMSESLLSHSYSLYIETSRKRQDSRTMAWSNVLKMIWKVTIDLNGLDGGSY